MPEHPTTLLRDVLARHPNTAHELLARTMLETLRAAGWHLVSVTTTRTEGDWGAAVFASAIRLDGEANRVETAVAREILDRHPDALDYARDEMRHQAGRWLAERLIPDA